MRKSIRKPRPVYLGCDNVLHVYNHAAGVRGELIFDAEDKEMFYQNLKHWTKLHYVVVLGYCVMDNHFHLIVLLPKKVPSLRNVAKRYNRFYKGKKMPLNVKHHKHLLIKERARLCSLGDFMKMVQEHFTKKYNKEYPKKLIRQAERAGRELPQNPKRRKGGFWDERYGAVALQGSYAVWKCLCYVELNMVRVQPEVYQSPLDYPFCSLGRYHLMGEHLNEEGFLYYMNKFPINNKPDFKTIHELKDGILSFILTNIMQFKSQKYQSVDFRESVKSLLDEGLPLEAFWERMGGTDIFRKGHVVCDLSQIDKNDLAQVEILSLFPTSKSEEATPGFSYGEKGICRGLSCSQRPYLSSA